jgi:hypothetical protein
MRSEVPDAWAGGHVGSLGAVVSKGGHGLKAVGSLGSAVV